MSTPRLTDVVTIGESMLSLQPMNEGPIAHAPLFNRSIAGAESNIAIGLTRLGYRVRWISRLGQDPFGDVIAATIAGEGVDVSMLQRDSKYPTALYFKEFKGYGDPNVFYYRSGSAMSQLSPEHVCDEWFEGAKHLHVTGITPALGPQTTDAIRTAMQRARALGLTVSFDPNLRRKLWGEEVARKTLLSLVPLCDLFLPGIEEAEFLLGHQSHEEYGKTFLSMGPSTVFLKLGEHGALGFSGDLTVRAQPYDVKRIVDTVGAGDAFATGILSEWLKSGSFDDEGSMTNALARGNLMGALATQFKGDWEGLPRKDELERLLSGKGEITR
ncbi:MAG: sugar kinase [Candidatus Cohnella colombiensis]|uniref:Sugar kinase n=1 Tax=Candidatus Cohnella colombiensis TaxID=3121368 RepID=A0AA95EVN9_9BACL|nr:MAG: sugar kinase [Cohnella sp.]